MNKKKKKGERNPEKFRLYVSIAIVCLDIIFLPWLIQLPFYLIENRYVGVLENGKNTGLYLWLDYGYFNSIKNFFSDRRLLLLFGSLQVFVAALIINIMWNVNKFRSKNKIQEGIGGPEAAGNGEHGTSRWMTEKEKEESSVVWDSNTELKKGGILFGAEIKNGVEKFYFDDDDTHTLIIGTTRSGKSRKIFLPSIWELAKAGESMIIGDPKGELFITSKEYLEEKGYNVISLNFREPLKGNQWNMMDLVNKAVDEENISKATEITWDMVNTITKQTPSTTSEPIWQNGEESTIAALTLLASLESDFKFQRHMTTAYYMLAEYGQPLADETIPLNEYMRTLPVRHPAKAAFATASIAPYKTRASFFTTTLSDLRLFSDPNISDMTSKQDHDMKRTGIDKTAVFLIIPDEKSTKNVLATLYIDQIYQSLVELANENGGRIPRRVNFLIDEFGNLPTIRDFATKITVGGGRGIRFALAVQDPAQIKKAYKESSQTIVGNCHTLIFISSSEPETCKFVSELTGKYTIETESRNRNVQEKGSSFGMGLGTTGRALLMPDEIRRWDKNEALVVRLGHHPARYKLPDLSQYRASFDFGMTIMENVEDSKKANNMIIKERWNNIKARKIEEVSVWLPDIFGNPKRKEPDLETENLNSCKESESDQEDFL